MNPLQKLQSLISGKYSKFIVALAATGTTGLETFYGNNSPTVNTIIAGIGALLVYLVPNTPVVSNDHVG
jgi:hypothetical protein